MSSTSSSTAAAAEISPTSPTARPVLGRWLHRLALLGCLCLSGAAWIPTFLHPGALLYRDMFVDAHPPLRASLFSGAATDLRTLPQDAILAAVGTVMDASWCVRLLLMTAWGVGCWASCQFVALWSGSGSQPRPVPLPAWRITLGRCAAIVLVSANPYVVERFLQGQWSVVMAGFLLPAVALAAMRRSWWLLAVLIAASLTPTGWILAVITAVAWWACGGVPSSSHSGCALHWPSTPEHNDGSAYPSALHDDAAPQTRSTPGGNASPQTRSTPGGNASPQLRRASRRSRTLGASTAATALVLCLPWVIPALRSESLTLSSVDSAAAFAANSDHLDSPGGLVIALLSLGGIWNKQAVPDSLHPLLTLLAGVVTLLLLVAAAGWAARGHRRFFLPWAVGVASVVLPVLAASSPGLEAMGWFITHIPGGGLVRDTQKFVILLLPVMLMGVGAAAKARRKVAVSLPLGAAVAVGLAIAVGSAPAVAVMRPAPIPAAWREVAEFLAVHGQPEDELLPLPLASYRTVMVGGTEAGDAQAAASDAVRAIPLVDPAGKLFEVRVLDPGALIVDGQVVGIDNPRAWQLASQAMVERTDAYELASAGVRWILLDASVQSTVDVSTLPAVSGSKLVAQSGDLALYRTP